MGDKKCKQNLGGETIQTIHGKRNMKRNEGTKIWKIRGGNKGWK